MKLSDEAIILIARQLQVAILTGTDVVDNLRLIDLEQEKGGDLLVPTQHALETHEGHIQSMLDMLEKGQFVPSSEEDGIVV
jgi:hypothetical protein